MEIDKNNNFLKQIKKVARITKIFISFAPDLKTQEYRSFFQSKFTKRFSKRKVGK